MKSVISSLLVISSGAVTFNKTFNNLEDSSFTARDYILAMLWNILAISSRVIALALFASQYRYWFAGVVIVQCLLWAAAAFIILTCINP